MPRGPRVVAAGARYHVTARGTGGGAIFLSNRDRSHFLALLAKTVTRQGWVCHAYCLMGTHYHLVLETPEPDLGRGMHRLNGAFAQGFNRRHGRFGHLFAERFHSLLVTEDGHALELIRYVALNPVRAGLCRRPWEWPWSSYGLVVAGRAPAFLAADRLLRAFGRDPRKAVVRLRAFVEG